MTPSWHDPPDALAAGGPPESLGALLSRVRTAAGRSQLRIAELLCAASGSPTVTRHEVSRWERGERIPNGHWLRWLALVLEVPLDELERATAVARTHRAGTGGPAPVVGLAARIELLRRCDDLVGGADLTAVVGRELRAALRAVQSRERSATPARAGSPSRRELLGLVAELAQLAGWVAADAGRDTESAWAHQIGLRAAIAAGDEPLAGHLLAALSHLGASDDPVRALRLARQGYARAHPTASATTRSLLLQRVAFAAARTGDRAGCERTLARAHRLYDRPDLQRDPSWLYWYTEDEFTAMAGRCYAVLGAPRTAEPLLRNGLDSGRIRLRPWALYSAWRAAAYLDTGEVEQACAVAGQALLTAVRVGSVRAADQVVALHPRLYRLRMLPAVRDYAELLRATRPYLPSAAASGQRGHNAPTGADHRASSGCG